jgi:hypothetical protein
MSIPIPEEVDGFNILKVTEEDLNVTQKQLLKKAVEDYKTNCLGIFSVTKRGEAIQKNAFPKPCDITITEDAVKFQETFDQAMHHAMINQSNVLMNSIQNAVRETMASGLQMGYKGLSYSQPKSSAPAASRAGSATMAGFGT